MPQSSPPPWRIGVLIVHGMGQQQRHQQLAECADALAQAFSPDQRRPVEPSIEYFTHRGHTEKKAVLKLGPLAPPAGAPPGQPSAAGRDVEVHVLELYWAHLLRRGTTLISVLLWIGWALYREFLPMNIGDKWGSKVRGSIFRSWLGFVILYVFIIAGLLYAGLAWFGALGLAHVFGQLIALSGGVTLNFPLLEFEHFTFAASVGEWVLRQWLPFLVFSVSIRSAYMLMSQAVPPRPGGTGGQGPPAGGWCWSPPEPPNKPHRLWWCWSLLGVLLLAAAWVHALAAASWVSALPITLLSITLLFAVPGNNVGGARWLGLPVWLWIWRPLIALVCSLPLLLWLADDTLISTLHRPLLDARSIVTLPAPAVGPAVPSALGSSTFLVLAQPLDAACRFLALAAGVPALHEARPAPSRLTWWILLGVLAFAILCVGISTWRAIKFGAWRAALCQLLWSVAALAGAACCLLVSGGMAAALTCLTLLLVAYGLARLILVEYFGDIQIFMTHSETSDTFDLRQRILGEARLRLEYLFGIELAEDGNCVTRADSDSPFASVAIVAHSTGCPVTYEALCRLMNTVEARPGGDVGIERIRRKFGLYVTYGCILEIVKFYFGRRAGSVPLYDRIDNAGLRQALLPAEAAQPERDVRPFYCGTWLNIRSELDAFTWPGILSFGQRIETRVVRPMVTPLLAHIQYFADNRFRWELADAIMRQCLVEPDCAAPPKD